MPDDFIRHMVRTVIESFPIDEAKKADMLRRIVDKKVAKPTPQGTVPNL